jgi:hypothetical protein
VLQFGYKNETRFFIVPAVKDKKKILEYKGHPLRRKDNIIYYGKMTDKHIIMLEILESKDFDDMKLATKVAVQLQLTETDIRSRDKILKKSEKSNFYEAMDVAAVWLNRALSSK